MRFARRNGSLSAVIPPLLSLFASAYAGAQSLPPSVCLDPIVRTGEVLSASSNGLIRIKERNRSCDSTFYRVQIDPRNVTGPMSNISVGGMGARFTDIKPGMTCTVLLRNRGNALVQNLNCMRPRPAPSPAPSPAPAPSANPPANTPAPATAPTPVPAPAGSLRWLPGPLVPANAVIGGQEPGRQLPVCRAAYQNGVHPGKVVEGKCNIGWGGGEIAIAAFEVLTNTGINIGWIAGPAVPGNAVIGGQEPGRQLPVCRTAFTNGIHPGKVVEGRCNIGYGGQEVALPSYEILVTR